MNIFRILAFAALASLAACATQPLSDSDRAVLMQDWQNQQAINAQTMSAFTRPAFSPGMHCSSVATGYIVNTNCY